MLNCAIYARISSDKSGKAEGVSDQETRCRRDVAERLGWNVVAVYTDNDISAHSGKLRPGYQAMMQDIRDGRIQAVAAVHTDRLHRRLPELIEFITLCMEQGTIVQTVRAGEMDLSTATGRSNALIGAVLAQQEVERGIERMLDAKQRAAQAGKYLGGPRPFGFQAGGIELNHVEAQAIREATRDVLAGASLASVCRRWNEAGLLTTRGNTWKMNSVRHTLMRPRNAGKSVHKGKVTGVSMSAPIVDEADWLGLCAVLNDPARRIALSNEWRWQGAGGAYLCGLCDGKMRVSGSKHHSKSYRCVEKGCISRKADVLDRFISDLMIGRLSMPDAVTMFASPKVAVDVPALSASKAALEARAGELGVMFADGDIDAVALRRGTERLRSEIADIEAELAKARESGPVEELVLDPAGVAAVWETKSAEFRSQVIRSVADVRVMPTAPGRRKFDSSDIDVTWKS